MAVAFQKTIPILRIFSVEKAKEFYVGFLGFTLDWEHHFEDTTPAYLQMSRDGLTLHLSEHHGDCCPGSTVFVWMTGIEEFHREITSRATNTCGPCWRRLSTTLGVSKSLTRSATASDSTKT